MADWDDESALPGLGELFEMGMMQPVAGPMGGFSDVIQPMGLMGGAGGGRAPRRMISIEEARQELAAIMTARKKDIEKFHPVGGGGTLRRPFSQMTSTTRPTSPLFLPDKQITPEDLPIGSWLLPLYGDKTKAGETLTHVNEQQLPTEQKLGGGGRFMQENPGRLWASDQGKAATVSKKVQELERESGQPVLATHVSMGARGSDFAKMTARTLLQMTDQKAIPDELAQAFDARMAADGVKNWPGIKNVNVEEWLATAPGGDRAKLAQVMELAPYQKHGAFGDVGSTRKAISEPELVHAPMLTSGMTVGKFAPGGAIAPDAGTHESYRTDWLGQHLGNLGQLPFDVMFPDVMARYVAKNPALAKNLPTIGYSVERQLPAQQITNQWQDQAMDWWLKRGGGR